MHTGKDTRLQRTGVLFVRKTKEEENKRESSEQAAPSALSGTGGTWLHNVLLHRGLMPPFQAALKLCSYWKMMFNKLRISSKSGSAALLVGALFLSAQQTPGSSLSR